MCIPAAIRLTTNTRSANGARNGVIFEKLKILGNATKPSVLYFGLEAVVMFPESLHNTKAPTERFVSKIPAKIPALRYVK